jgi:hypothetical protein
MQNIDRYAHVMLFACPQCERPLSATCLSTKSNLEVADAEWFTPHCRCGWTREISGVTAVRHWVAPWRGNPVVVPGEAGSCDGKPISHEVS